MTPSTQIPTRASVKKQYHVNKYMAAKKRQVQAEAALISLVALLGVYVSTILF